MEVSGFAAAVYPLAVAVCVPAKLKPITTSTSSSTTTITTSTTTITTSTSSSTRTTTASFRSTSLHLHLPHSQMVIGSRRRRRGLGGVGVICLAAPDSATLALLSRDAPFAVAIAASILHSLFFPLTPASPDQQEEEDDEEGAALVPTDVRFPVMTIISLIPFFNWLSWVFAFMDTGNRRYAVYAAVYLAPYLRTNLSLSPDESWLPIASIVLCSIHIQLEASITSGDLDAFAFFHEAALHFGLVAKSKDNHSTTLRKSNKGKSRKLPSSQSQWRDREDHKNPSREAKHGNEDSDLDDGTDHL